MDYVKILLSFDKSFLMRSYVKLCKYAIQ